MYVYSFSYKVDTKKSPAKRFTDHNEVLNEVKAVIVKYAQKMGINAYISAIRQGINAKYRAAIADYLESFFSSDVFDGYSDSRPFDDTPEDYLDEPCESIDPITDFECISEAGVDIISFNFGNRLSIETNLFYGTDSEVLFFVLKSTKHRVEVTVNEAFVEWHLEKPRSSANILFVYRCLTDVPKTREQICAQIKRYANTDVSPKTVGKHLKSLRALGVPIAHKGINKYLRAENASLGVADQVGFYLENDRPLCEAVPAEIGNIGTRVYSLLVLLTLQCASEPMLQADILRRIEKKYGVSINRAAVGRHLKMLEELGYPISKTKAGIVLEQK